ncbi:deaminase, partial [Enterococcus faecalis]
HDRHEAETTTVKGIIRLTKEYGLQHKVFISHAFGLNDFIAEERDELYDALAAEKIHNNSRVPITPNTHPSIMAVL